MADEKPGTDWEAIEEEYRAGVYTLRQIGKRYHVSEGAIRKRAKKEGWTRRLIDKVKAEVADQTVRSAGTQGGTQSGSQRTDRQIIDDYVKQVDIVLCGHRATATRARLLANRLFAELEEATAYQDAIEDAIEEETAGDRSPKRRERMLRAVGLGSRAMILDKLARAIVKITAVERQAFGLPADNTVQGDGTAPTVIDITPSRYEEVARRVLDKF